MSAPIEFNLSKDPIYDHCFSHDQQTVAITRLNTVEIYDVSQRAGPKLVAKLEDHDKTVTAVDINSKGQIVTCSQDRNALVWEKQSDGSYKSTLVLLRINRAATTVRWSPNGDKFAVGSSDRAIAICYFEEENDWWISKHIKKPLKSTILSLDWHENNVLLACGSTDGHVRVFSAYIKAIDSKPPPTVWGAKLPFQTLCLDANLKGWVHDIKFDPAYQFLAAVTHDSNISFVYPGQGDGEIAGIFKVKNSSLPFNSILFVNSGKVVAAGNDCHPVVFEYDDAKGWYNSYSIDDPNKKAKSGNENQTALNMFRQLDLKGSSKNVSGKLATVHQNAITKLRTFQKDSQGVLRFTSSGNDGKVVLFDV